MIFYASGRCVYLLHSYINNSSRRALNVHRRKSRWQRLASWLSRHWLPAANSRASVAAGRNRDNACAAAVAAWRKLW